MKEFYEVSEQHEQEFDDVFPIIPEACKTKFDKALERYEQTFSDYFPTIPMMDKTEAEMIEIIDKCISEKKSVYEMGYLSSDPDIYY